MREMGGDFHSYRQPSGDQVTAILSIAVHPFMKFNHHDIGIPKAHFCMSIKKYFCSRKSTLLFLIVCWVIYLWDPLFSSLWQDQWCHLTLIIVSDLVYPTYREITIKRLSLEKDIGPNPFPHVTPQVIFKTQSQYQNQWEQMFKTHWRGSWHRCKIRGCQSTLPLASES